MPPATPFLCLAFAASLLATRPATAQGANGKPERGSTEGVDITYRSPAESLATMRFQDGYGLRLAAAEPMVQEPCLCVWDGDGRMYVAELRTFMQDADGTDKFEPRSRVVRLEDTDWDGVMDRRTVFADKLVLPRVVLPLGDKVIIGETNTLDLYAYRDTDGDGVADEKKLWHAGGRRGGNLEHQPSGLIWAVDNWIYRTYGTFRMRLKDGEVIKEDCPGAGQWGLTADDEGKVIYVNGGSERGPEDFDTHTLYGRHGGAHSEDFRTVWPRDNVPDVQGGLPRLRDDNTLNHFTATCGQSIYRARRLPADFYGNLIFCEPVGRLIRRAVFTEELGATHLRNAYHHDEFITSTDANFRPINSALGPDGSLYIVDMYRGIIQEGNWVKKGSYLRKVVDRLGLAKNVMRGRIWRVTHRDFERNPERPRMLGKPAAELVKYLSHENGWWRDTAQKLIVVSGDKSVASALQDKARTDRFALGRLHALWTLDGLGLTDRNLLIEKLADDAVVVQCAAMRIAEDLIRGGDADLLARVQGMAGSTEPQLLKQLVLTISRSKTVDKKASLRRIQERHPKVTGVAELCDRLIAAHDKALADAKKRRRMKEQARLDLISYNAGKSLYETLCFSCHGNDGRAMVVGEAKMAADFANSVRLRYAHPDALVKTVLHGLTGEVSGHKHVGVMVPMNSYDDKVLAGVLNYIRNSFGNQAGYIDAKDVRRVRKATADRQKPYTERELLHEHPAYAKIHAAVPDAPPARPLQQRRLLVFSDSRGHQAPVGRGILALEAMSAKTGAFEAVFSDQVGDLAAGNLTRYDAVFLNNTANIEKALNDELRKALVEFVRRGGGLAAIHAAADGGWKEFTAMLGGRARGRPWRGDKSRGVRVRDPGHPVVAPLRGDFEIQDELFRFPNLRRAAVRVLLAVDLARSDQEGSGEDGDNPLAWIRGFGKGRVFYSALGHRPEVFEDPQVLGHWLAGIQFALGDLEADATPLRKPEKR